MRVCVGVVLARACVCNLMYGCAYYYSCLHKKYIPFQSYSKYINVDTDFNIRNLV